MTIITRTIQNNLSTDINIFVPGYDPDQPPLVIAAGTTVDLFTVITGDQLEAIQGQLQKFVDAGDLTVTATTDTATFSPSGVDLTNVTTDILPDVSDTHSLGSLGQRWDHLSVHDVQTNAVGSLGDLILASNGGSFQIIFNTENSLNCGGVGIGNMADPVNPQDAATKHYVDNHGGGGASATLDFVASTSTTNGTDQTLFTASSTGLYRVDGYMFTHTAAGGNATVYFTLKWNDGSFGRQLGSGDGSSGWMTANCGGTGEGSLGNSVVVYLTAGQSITWNTVYASIGFNGGSGNHQNTGGGSYDLHVAVVPF